MLGIGETYPCSTRERLTDAIRLVKAGQQSLFGGESVEQYQTAFAAHKARCSACESWSAQREHQRVGLLP